MTVFFKTVDIHSSNDRRRLRFEQLTDGHLSSIEINEEEVILFDFKHKRRLDSIYVYKTGRQEFGFDNPLSSRMYDYANKNFDDLI